MMLLLSYLVHHSSLSDAGHMSSRFSSCAIGLISCSMIGGCASINTPGVVSLKRNRKYFLPARYTATIEAPGYAPTNVPIGYTVNPWILGNVVIGGVPGLLVDNATGAAWKPRHTEIHGQLAPL